MGLNVRQEHLDRQRRGLDAFAVFLQERFAGQVHYREPPEPTSHWDAVYYLDSIAFAVVEFKGRNVAHDKYGGYAYVRQDKLEWCREEARRIGARCVMLLDYTDGLFFIEDKTVIEKGILEVGNGRDYEVERYRFPSALLRRIGDSVQ